VGVCGWACIGWRARGKIGGREAGRINIGVMEGGREGEMGGGRGRK